MILGREALIVDLETARRLVVALAASRSNKDYKRLQELGLLEFVNEVDRVVRELESAVSGD